MDYEWRVKQRQAIENAVRKKNTNMKLKDQSAIEILYDYNGRRINKKSLTQK